MVVRSEMEIMRARREHDHSREGPRRESPICARSRTPRTSAHRGRALWSHTPRAAKTDGTEGTGRKGIQPDALRAHCARDGEMKQTQTGPALWALDANIAMAQGLRRILCGSAELTGACVLVPERVLELIAHLYGEVAERRAEKITEWESETEKIQWSDEEEEELIVERTLRLVVERTLRLEGVLAQWARSETTRNDGTWQIADDTAESRKTALKMKREGIARGSTYQGVEEDAAVAAQALEAGCRWIASHNQHVLGGDEFERQKGGSSSKPGRRCCARGGPARDGRPVQEERGRGTDE